MIIELGLRRGTTAGEAAELANYVRGESHPHIATVQVVDKAATIQGSPHAAIVASATELADIMRRLADKVHDARDGDNEDFIAEICVLGDEADALLRQINAR